MSKHRLMAHNSYGLIEDSIWIGLPKCATTSLYALWNNKNVKSQYFNTNKDILKLDFDELFGNAPFAVIGNFPYNISSQIVFKVLKHRNRIPFFAGMFQKEVAKRLCEAPGTKQYGILSVLVQLFYETSYLFEVPPGAFIPPPNVDSAVIQFQRKENYTLNCDEKLLFKVVKLSFQQRRKTLRNSLKTLGIPENIREGSIFDLRPEKLSGQSFVELTKRISDGQL